MKECVEQIDRIFINSGEESVDYEIPALMTLNYGSAYTNYFSSVAHY